jgi:outer membrane protein assembly factor BamB
MKMLLLLLVMISSTFGYAQTLVETVDLPSGTFYDYSYGLVYDNGKYWISSSSSTAGNGVINAVNSSGVQVDQLTINYPTMKNSQGLAFDGTDFWYVERKTARCDLFKVSTTGVVIDSIPGTELFGSNVYLGGAVWDGTGLWISVYYPDAIAALYKVNVAARAIVDTIPVIGLQPTGITTKGDTLIYVNDGFNSNGSQGYDSVYAVNMNTKDLLFSFGLPHPSNVTNAPKGLAWDGTYFWLLAKPVGASTGRQLFKYDLSGGGTPQISVSPMNLFFPNTTVGNPSDVVLGIYNTGNATLTINSININNNVFSYSGVTPPFDIIAGGSQQVTVTFAPTGYNYFTGTLTINSNDPVHMNVDVGLNGQGVLDGARIGVTSNSHNFGNVWVGEEGLAFWKFKTFNMGNSTLEITDMSFELPEYTFDAPSIPFNINSTDTVEITVYFYPLSVGMYIDTLKIVNNDLTNPLFKIAVQGNGIFDDYDYGYMFWQYQVPLHPNSPSMEPRVEGLKYINDITGDGIPEVIISTENYWTMCLDGAASGTSYPLWIFTTYLGNSNAGSLGQSWEYGVQDAIQIAEDLNGDGYNDVVIAIGGGNEHVYALDGTNGQIIWEYGDNINWDLGDFSAVDVQRDFNGDGVVDVLAIADGNSSGTGYKRAFLFDGTNGNIIWQHFYPGPNPSFGKTIISIEDINGDNIPDAIIAYGNNGTLDKSVRALSGANGQVIWTRDMVAYNPKELLELPLPGGGSDIIVAEYFNRIHRLNGLTGEIVWTYPLGTNAGVIQIALIDDVDSDQIQDVVIASFAGNGLNCLSGGAGTQLWAKPMAFQFGVAAIPDIDDDGVSDVIAGDQSGTLFVMSGKDGESIFNKTLSPGYIYTVNSMPSIDGNFSWEVITGTTTGKVVCYSGGTVVVPVELATFYANVSAAKVFLNWTTSTEKNNLGFEIERTSPLHESWEKIGFVQGSGTTTESRSYSFSDENISSGVYSYRLKQIDFDGTFEYSDIVEVNVGTPNEYVLEQNYPNPFNPSTTINYSLKAKSNVVLKIFDVLGNEVTTLVNEEQEAGYYKFEFNAVNFASGVYLYILKAGEFVSTKKMILLK